MVVHQHATAPIAGVFFGSSGGFDFTDAVHGTHAGSARHPSAACAVALVDHHGVVLRREPNLAAVAAALMFNHIASWERVSGDAGVAEAAGETHLLYEEYAGGGTVSTFSSGRLRFGRATDVPPQFPAAPRAREQGLD